MESSDTVQTGRQQQQQQRLDSRLPAAGSTKCQREKLQVLPTDEIVAFSDTNATDGDGLRSSTAQFLYGRPSSSSFFGAGVEKYACVGKLRRTKRENPEILLKWGAKKVRTAALSSAAANYRGFDILDGNSLIITPNGDLERDSLLFLGRKVPRGRRRQALRIMRLGASDGNSCTPKMISNETISMVSRMETCSKTLPQSPAGPVTPVPIKQKRSQKRKLLGSLGDIGPRLPNVGSGEQSMRGSQPSAGERRSETDPGALFVDLSSRRVLFCSREQEVSETLPCAFQVQPAERAGPALECELEGNQHDSAVAKCDRMFGKNGLSADRESPYWNGTGYPNGVGTVVDTLNPIQRQQSDEYLQDVIRSTDLQGNGYSCQLSDNLLGIAGNIEDSNLDPSTPLKFPIARKTRSKWQVHTEQEFDGEPLHAGCLHREGAALLKSVENLGTELLSALKSRSSSGTQKALFDLNEAPLQNDESPVYLREEQPDPIQKRSTRKHPRPKVLKDVTKPARVPKPKKASNPRKAQSTKPRRTTKSNSQAAQMKQQAVFPAFRFCEGQVDGRLPENLLRENSLGPLSKPWRMRAAARLRKGSISVQTVEGDSIRPVDGVALGIADLKLLDAQSRAIVPVCNTQRAIVLHAKSRQKAFKPKVHLEDGDLQWWKLVMTHGPSYEDKNDDATAEKWANERSLFKLRAEKFIGLMHQVQGNRRFSRWKGSVIDSVVGAFLTQNVSDHLSSSAFMLLASTFPISGSSRETIFREVRVEETFEPAESYTDATPLRTIDADKDYLVEEPTATEDQYTVEEPPVVEIPSTVEELEKEHMEFWHSPPRLSVQDVVTDIESQDQAHYITANDVEGTSSGGFQILGELEDGNSLSSSLPQEAEGEDSSTQSSHQEATVGNTSINRVQSTAAVHLPSENPSLVKENEKVSYLGLTGSERAKLEQTRTRSKDNVDWEGVRKSYAEQPSNESSQSLMEDAVDWETVRVTDVDQIADVIKERGMNNMLAGRIKGFLSRVHTYHGSLDLEWLRTIPPEQAKKFLLSIHGLGLKSVECVRLLTLHHLAFPVDTNVGRICVRLGWVPIEPLPEVKLLSELETYPVQENIQKYLWPRLCTLDQPTLYELHYQMITFGKVFCTKRDPNCNACPLRNDCRHYADSVSRSRNPEITFTAHCEPSTSHQKRLALPATAAEFSRKVDQHNSTLSVCEPIIEEPPSPPRYSEAYEEELVDSHKEGTVPEVTLYLPEIPSNALVIVPPNVAAQPVPKLKSVGRLRTVHYVYELKDDHPLINKIGARVADDPCPILLAIWGPGESPDTDVALSDAFQRSQVPETPLDKEDTVKGTLLVPCRTANRGSFPLNGTYFQVNEVFADHQTSINPIDVPRRLLWDLTRRFVYFGTSVTSIFKGLNVEEITYAFQWGYVCVRGFDNVTRAPKPLQPRLHSGKSVVNKKRQKQQEQPEKNDEDNGHVTKDSYDGTNQTLV